VWHLIVLEWDWDLAALPFILKFAGHEWVSLLYLGGAWFLWRRRARVVRWINRTASKKLGPRDEHGWRVKINYDRKEPWD